jgi:hypothetical protein
MVHVPSLLCFTICEQRFFSSNLSQNSHSQSASAVTKLQQPHHMFLFN